MFETRRACRALLERCRSPSAMSSRTRLLLPVASQRNSSILFSVAGAFSQGSVLKPTCSSIRLSSSAAQPPPPPPLAKPTNRASRFPSPSSPGASKSTYDAAKNSTFDINSIIGEGLDNFYNQHASRARREPELRLRPALGRTVHVTGGVDVGRALKMLDRQCRDNQLRKLVRLQRFHERGGLRRKRLRSERWRARFKEAFAATLQRVRQLKKQGW